MRWTSSKLLQNWCALLFGLAVALAVAEIVLRLYNPFGFRVKGHKIILPTFERLAITNHRIKRLDNKIIHTRNSLGFRGEEPPRNFVDYLTLLFVGGSTTECFYISDHKTWPHLLGERLKKSFNDVWVNNAGLEGHSTFGHNILMQDFIVRLKPKVVVFLVGVNDIGYGNAQPQPICLRDLSNTKSEVLSLMINLQNHLRTIKMKIGDWPLNLADSEEIEIPPKQQADIIQRHRWQYLDGYQQRLTRLIETAQQEHMVPVLITQPILVGFGIDGITGRDLAKVKLENFAGQAIPYSNGELSWKIMELYNDVTRKVAIEKGVFLIDLAVKMPKDSRYFYDAVHFTNEGAERVSYIVKQDLTPFLKQHFPKYAD